MIIATSGKNCHCLGAWWKKKAWTKSARWTPPSSSRTRWTTCCWTFPVGSLTMNAVNHRWSSDSRDAFNLYVHIQYVFERYHRFVLIGVSHFGVFVFTLCMCQVTIPSSTIARENIGRNWSAIHCKNQGWTPRSAGNLPCGEGGIPREDGGIPCGDVGIPRPAPYTSSRILTQINPLPRPPLPDLC